MPQGNFEPVTLVPIEFQPHSDDMMIEGRSALEYSKLFPVTLPVHLEGPLGDYRGGYPPKGSPLRVLLGGLEARRAKLNANGQEKTEEIRAGLCATDLQLLLTRCIDKSYRNVLLETGSPGESVSAVETYIDDTDAEQHELYNFRIDNLLSSIAKLERDGLEGYSEGEHSEIDLDVKGRPLSQDEKLQEALKIYADHIAEARRGLKRLRFEWMSAVAITHALRNGVVFK